ncbi:MAG: DUF4249 family protein [Bacteroidota bacterium]
MKKLFVLGIIPFVFWGCITEIDFDLQGESRIVIDGVISNSPGERFIRIRRTSGFDSLYSPVQATGRILRNGDVWQELFSPAAGTLALRSDALIQAGNTYQLEVETEEGNSYRSEAQMVQPPFRVDSLSFDIVPAELRDNNGNTRFSRLVRFFAHLDIPIEGRSELYFKWQFNNIYAFQDRRPITCYLQDPLTRFPATLIRGRDLQPGNVRVFLASTELNRNFLIRYNVNTELHMVDLATFNFYENATRLVSNQGTLFDELPGLLEGNVKQVGEDEESIVLGFVEFSLADTARLPINRSDFTFQLQDNCETATCPPAAPDGSPSPCACADCGDFFGRETEIPPSYW